MLQSKKKSSLLDDAVHPHLGNRSRSGFSILIGIPRYTFILYLPSFHNPKVTRIETAVSHTSKVAQVRKLSFYGIYMTNVLSVKFLDDMCDESVGTQYFHIQVRW